MTESMQTPAPVTDLMADIGESMADIEWVSQEGPTGWTIILAGGLALRLESQPPQPVVRIESLLGFVSVDRRRDVYEAAIRATGRWEISGGFVFSLQQVDDGRECLSLGLSMPDPIALEVLQTAIRATASEARAWRTRLKAEGFELADDMADTAPGGSSSMPPPGFDRA